MARFARAQRTPYGFGFMVYGYGLKPYGMVLVSRPPNQAEAKRQNIASACVLDHKDLADCTHAV
jgi:hypothetical protein